MLVFFKTHIKSYTRHSSGNRQVLVREHEDKRSGYGNRIGADQLATTYTLPDGTVFRRYPSRKIGKIVIPEGWALDRGKDFVPPVGSLKITVEEAVKDFTGKT